MPHIARGGKERRTRPRRPLQRPHRAPRTPARARRAGRPDPRESCHGIAVSDVTDSNGCSAHKMLRLPVTLRMERRTNPPRGGGLFAPWVSVWWPSQPLWPALPSHASARTSRCATGESVRNTLRLPWTWTWSSSAPRGSDPNSPAHAESDVADEARTSHLGRPRPCRFVPPAASFAHPELPAGSALSSAPRPRRAPAAARGPV